MMKKKFMRILSCGMSIMVVIIFLSFGSGSLLAEGETANTELRKVLGLFGSITSYGTSLESISQDRGANVSTINLSIGLANGSVSPLESAFSGPVIFHQILSGGKTSSLPRITSLVAIGQEDGFLGIYQNLAGNIAAPPSSWYQKGSKITVESENPVLAQNSWRMSVFDTNKAAWVNPLLFNTVSFADTADPQILSIAFHKADAAGAYVYDKKLKSPFSIKQGKYRLGIEMLDRPQKGGSFSGIHAVRIIMDGVTVLENKLDTILVSDAGFAPFGNKPPSQNSIDPEGRLIFGELDLVRGIHLLDITALDFAGNQASLQLRLTVE